MNFERNPVEIKGIKDGLLIILDGNTPIEELVTNLEQRLFNSGGFFQHGTVKVQVKNRPFDMAELNRLTGLFSNQDRLELTEVLTEDGEVLAKVPTKTRQNTGSKTVQQDYQMENCLVIKRTVRSGQKIEFPGTILVLGNVNPGAELLAGGDIIVLGELKGVCHAGAKGNDHASIAALKLMAGQLRIAALVSRAPENEELEPEQPEIAFIQGSQIVVETLTGKDFSGHFKDE